MLKSRIPMIVAELRPRIDVALRAGAGLVEEGARQRVHVRSGALRDAIHVERQGSGEYAVMAGNDEVFWGSFEEYGTSHSAPHPFLVPALEAEREAIVGEVLAMLRTL